MKLQLLLLPNLQTCAFFFLACSSLRRYLESNRSDQDDEVPSWLKRVLGTRMNSTIKQTIKPIKQTRSLRCVRFVRAQFLELPRLQDSYRSTSDSQVDIAEGWGGYAAAAC